MAVKFIAKQVNYKIIKMPACNKRFGVSRGVTSRKVLREFESLSPVRAFAFPRPNAKPPQRYVQAGECG